MRINEIAAYNTAYLQTEKVSNDNVSFQGGPHNPLVGNVSRRMNYPNAMKEPEISRRLRPVVDVMQRIYHAICSIFVGF